MGSGIISILETIRANVKEIDDFYKGTVAAKREEIKKKENSLVSSLKELTKKVRRFRFV